jgi:hypothetical protein
MSIEELKEIWNNDPPSFGEGWKNPAMLEVQQNDWGDSLWVTPDGKRIYFMWIRGDLLSTILLGKGQLTDDADVYYSDSPFVKKQLETKHSLSEDYFGAAGPMIDDGGNYWYMSNRQWQVDKTADTDIYLNDQLLPFNTDAQEVNPHYCTEKDELWFDEDDTRIMVLKNAKANGFSGTPIEAPAPINSGDPQIRESQPWLSRDCQILYFTSGRLGTNAIFKSERIDEDTWSEPTPIVYGTKYGVGEPSLTHDGKEGARLFYEQIIRNEETKVFTTLFFYVQQ